MAKKGLIIIGAGQTIDEIYPIIKSNYNYKITKILDDNKSYFKKDFKGIPIEIGIENARKFKNCDFIFGIGSYKNKNQREKIFLKAELDKKFFPNFIHRNTIIENNVIMGYGNIIYPFSTICSGTNISDFCIFTYSCVIAHKVNIDSFSIFGSRTSILNEAKIGREVFIGANVLVGENIDIGDKSRILFGSLVIKNVKKNTTIFGNPGAEIA